MLINLTALAFGCILGLLLLEAVLRIYNPFEQCVRGDRIVLPAKKNTS
jgi:hypothetical protein